MPDEQLPRRLGPMDAMFIFGDSPNAPQVIGNVCEFEGRIPFKRFQNTLNDRLQFVPRYRQVLVEAPLFAGMPSWEDDVEFDINNHVFEHRLEKPGDDAQFIALAQDLFQGKLDMNRPLWQIHLVYGLKGNRTGAVMRVHHCLVDGIAGVELLRVLFDITPETPKVPKKKFHPRRPPGRGTQLYNAMIDNLAQGLDHWTRMGAEILSMGRDKDMGSLAKTLREFGGTLGHSLLKPTERFHFNKSFTGRRVFAFASRSLAETRRMRGEFGGTINDVVLAVLTEGMRRYLHDHDEETEGKCLTYMIPVNVRGESESGAMGNRITLLPVKVPLDELDPVERVDQIHQTIQELKQSDVPRTVGLFLGMLQGTHPLFQKLTFGSLLSNELGLRVLGHVPQWPPANLICTNIPGPQIPLYAVGHRLLRMYPLLALILDMGVSTAITSYDQRLYVSFIGDEGCADDVDRLRDHFMDAWDELRHAANVEEGAYIELKRPAIERTKARPAAKRVTKKKPAAKRKGAVRKKTVRAKENRQGGRSSR